MSKLAFIQTSLQSLHSSLDEAMEELSQEQAHWRPNENGNHIAFIAWHYTRTVDNLVRFVLQQRRPTVWMEGKWDERFGLARGPRAPARRRGLRISGHLHEQVWKETQTRHYHRGPGP